MIEFIGLIKSVKTEFTIFITIILTAGIIFAFQYFFNNTDVRIRLENQEERRQEDLEENRAWHKAEQSMITGTIMPYIMENQGKKR